mgnify:FL=1|jgi:hypothetical protein|nr:MAG TPA: hypothetical protein [Caudoviricetes sp.]
MGILSSSVIIAWYDIFNHPHGTLTVIYPGLVEYCRLVLNVAGLPIISLPLLLGIVY